MRSILIISFGLFLEMIRAANNESSAPFKNFSSSTEPMKIYTTMKKAASDSQHTTMKITTKRVSSLESLPNKNMSIEDIILSGLNSSSQIEDNIRKIINMYTSSYNSVRAVKLTTRSYLLENGSIEILQNSVGKISFHNIQLIDWYEEDVESVGLYATEVECDSFGNITAQVDLPNIMIMSDVLITSASGRPSHGSISITLGNGTIFKKVNTNINDTSNSNLPAEIYYKSSKYQVNITSKYQIAIYNELQSVLNEVKLSLGRFLATQIDFTLITNDSSIIDSCVKLHSTRVVEANNLNEMYVISDAINKKWSSINFGIGPAILEGLSHFKKIKYKLWDIKHLIKMSFCRNKFLVQLIVDNLKGKVKWGYNSTHSNSSLLTYPFTIDFITINCEVKPDGDNPGGYANAVVEVILGDIQIETSEENKSKEEKKFVNIFLLEQLKSLIDDWFRKHLSKKILDKYYEVECSIFN